MTAAVRAEPAERRSHHPNETLAVGAERGQLDAGLQVGIALADARSVEIDLHAAQPPDQFGEPRRRIIARDVDFGSLDLLRSLRLEPGERPGIAARGTHAPAGGDAKPGQLQPQTRSGAHDDDTLLRPVIPACATRFCHHLSVLSFSAGLLPSLFFPFALPEVLRGSASASESAGAGSSAAAIRSNIWTYSFFSPEV